MKSIEPTQNRPGDGGGTAASSTQGLSPSIRQEIATLRTSRSNVRTVLELGSTYAIIGLAIYLLKAAPHWSVYPVAFLLIGMMQYRLVMSSHEAVHKTLLTPVWLNETFGSVHAALVGISFFNYRKTHLEHHKSPQYIRDDSDAYIYKPLLESRPGLPRLALLLFGVWVDIAEKLKRKIAGVGAAKSTSGEVKGPSSQLWLISLMQLLALGFFTWVLGWQYYFIFWFAPIFCIALTMDRIRIFVEHGYHYVFCETGTRVDEAIQTTVDIHTNPLESYLLAPFGFVYHQAHHAQLTVPYYNLRKLSSLLLQNDPRYNAVVKGSYLGILARMIWSTK